MHIHCIHEQNITAFDAFIKLMSHVTRRTWKTFPSQGNNRVSGGAFRRGSGAACGKMWETKAETSFCVAVVWACRERFCDAVCYAACYALGYAGRAMGQGVGGFWSGKGRAAAKWGRMWECFVLTWNDATERWFWAFVCSGFRMVGVRGSGFREFA